MSKIRIGFTGDFCPIARIEELYISGNWRSCFESVLSFFMENDFNIVDLECPLTHATKGIVKTGPHIKSKQETTEILKYLHSNLVATANNHFKDYGWAGMKDTYDVLQNHGIDWCGSGINHNEASKTKEIEIKGLRFAIINMTENEWSTTHGDEPGCNPLDYPIALQAIQAARESNVDFIIVILHGGHEYYPLPSPRMKSQFRFMIDAGADAVLGHHTHIISGYEVYKNKPIFYGLGNFCFDWPGLRNSTWNRGMILRLIFEKSSGVQFEYLLVHQNDHHVGVKLMDEAMTMEQEREIQRLNSIIADNKQLKKSFEEYADGLKSVMLSRIQPYRTNFFITLNRRGILPDIMGFSKKKMIKILAQCESHREVLLQALKDIK